MDIKEFWWREEARRQKEKERRRERLDKLYRQYAEEWAEWGVPKLPQRVKGKESNHARA